MILNELPARFSVCRLRPDAAVPEPMRGGLLSSVTRTPRELSVVCECDRVPPEVRSESGWAAFEVQGPLDFGLTGILASLSAPIARAELSIFVLSTYDTDYLLVREEAAASATKAWRAEGHRVNRRTGAEEVSE